MFARHIARGAMTRSVGLAGQSTQQLGRVFLSTEPTKMLTAYQAFVKDRLPQLREANSELKASEVMKMAGSEWRGMEEAAKSSYANKYEAPPKKERKNKANKVDGDGEPKKTRAPSAYAKFVKANFSKHSEAGVQAKEVMKLLGAEWKQLTTDEKAKYK